MKRKLMRLATITGTIALAVTLFGTSTYAQVQTNQSPLTIVTKKTYKLVTRQQILEDSVNDTGNPLPLKLRTTSDSSMKTVDTSERSRDESSVQKFHVASSVSFEYAGAKGSAEASYDFEKTIAEHVKTGREVTHSENRTQAQDRDLLIAPGRPVFRALNITSGGGYSYSYETNQRMVQPPPDVVVTVTIKTDLNPLFNALMDKVTEMGPGIRTDSGGWGRYVEICNEARIRGFNYYLARATSPTNGVFYTAMDGGSWTAVKTAAENASRSLAAGNRGDALAFVLLGFNNVRNPSHNDWAWAALRDLGNRLMSGR